MNTHILFYALSAGAAEHIQADFPDLLPEGMKRRTRIWKEEQYEISGTGELPDGISSE